MIQIIITYIAGEFMNCPIFWHVIFLVWIILRKKKETYGEHIRELKASTIQLLLHAGCMLVHSASQHLHPCLSQCHLPVLSKHRS